MCTIHKNWGKCEVFLHLSTVTLIIHNSQLKYVIDGDYPHKSSSSVTFDQCKYTNSYIENTLNDIFPIILSKRTYLINIHMRVMQLS